MTEPLVTIIIPVYNAERHVARCLDSIAAQTFSSIEVIVVDDGSTDGTPSVVESYAQKHPWFRCIRQANSGPGEARNTGIAASRSKYLSFVDADDFAAPDFVETLYRLAEESRAEIAVCSFYVLLPNGLRFTYPFSTFTRRMTGVEGARKTLSMLNLPGVVWNKLYLRELFTENGIRFPSCYYEDAVTVCMLMLNAKAVAVTRKPLYYYLRHKQSLTGKFSEKHVDDYLKATGILRDYLANKHLWENWKKPFRKFLRRVEAHLLAGISIRKKRSVGLSRFKEIRRVHRQLKRLK
jgi:glycosyltransferase EpsH